jgi:hypothetical protein
MILKALINLGRVPGPWAMVSTNPDGYFRNFENGCQEIAFAGPSVRGDADSNANAHIKA